MFWCEPVSASLHKSCMQASVNALASLRICADSPEHSLLADAISTKISYTGKKKSVVSRTDRPTLPNQTNKTKSLL